MDVTAIKHDLLKQLPSFYPDLANQSFEIDVLPFDYQRGSSFVVPLQIASAVNRKKLFVKIPNEDFRVAQEVTGLQKSSSIFKANTSLRVPTLLGTLSQDKGLILEASPGSLLLAHLTENISFFASEPQMTQIDSLMKQCASWLRTFHQIEVQEKSFDLEHYLTIFERYHKELKEHQVSSALLKRLDAFLQELEPLKAFETTYVQSHDDFGPGNVLVDGHSVTVMDIPWGFVDSIYHDLSYFILQLETLNFSLKKLFFNQSQMTRYKETFIATYFEGNKTDEMLLEMFYLRNMMRRASGLYGKMSDLGWFEWPMKQLRFEPYFQKRIDKSIHKILELAKQKR